MLLANTKLLTSALLIVLILVSVPMEINRMQGSSFTYVTSEPYVFVPKGQGAELLLDSEENFYILHVEDGDVCFRKYDYSHRISIPDLILFHSGENKRVDATFDDLGFIHLTWSTDFYGAWSTMYMKIDSGGSVVVPAIKLSGDNSAWDFASAIDVNSLGQAYVAWDYWWNPSDPVAEDVLYAKIDSDGSIIFTQQYVAPENWDTAFYGKKDIVVDRDDNLHIIFDRQYSNFDIYVYYKKFASDGTTVLVSEKQLIPTVYKGWASAMEAILDSQERINIGQTYGVSGGKMETFYVRIDLEGNIDIGPILLSHQDQYHSHQAYLAMDDYDNSYVFWRETKDGNAEIYYAVVDQNGTVVLNLTRLTDTPENEVAYYMGAVFDFLGSCYWSYYNEDGTYVVYPVAPVADAGGPYVAAEGDMVLLSAHGSYDENGEVLQYRWDLDADGTWDTSWSQDANLSVVWGDDINATARVEVTDGVFVDTDVAFVTVHNVVPNLEEINWSAQAGGEPRTVGYWKHQCGEDLNSPDHVGIQQQFIDYISQHSSLFAGISSRDEVCSYIEGIENRNMTQKAIQQLMALWLNVASGKLNLSAEMFIPQLNTTMSLWEGLVWIEDTILNDDKENMETAKNLADEINNGHLIEYAVATFWTSASDPGSDDLVFTWNWGDGTTTEHIYYNNGMFPDPYPSPEVNPVYVTDTAKHSYRAAGSYLVTLTVRDDDGGQTQWTFVLSL